MAIQTDIIERLETGSRVAILRLRSLGDCVLTTPAIALLKAHRPDLEIGIAVEPRFAAVYEHNPDISAILEPTARSVRGFAPLLCLNLHGGTRSARLTLLSGARFRAGFEIFKPSWIYNTPIPTAQETMGIKRRVHTAEHLASAMFHLGVPIGDVPRARLYPTSGRSSYAPSGPYAVLHPYAATLEKSWPMSSFQQLSSYIKSIGLEPIFLGGPGEPATVSGAPLSEVIQLMRDASLFVGNDSGPAHVAAAFGVPQVVLFGSSDVEVWAPWKTPSRVSQATPIGSIAVEEAIRAVDEVRG